MAATSTGQPRDRSQLGNAATGVRAVLFDFGGVLSTSPFEGFAAYERDHGLPTDFLRSLNARDHHGNAWARLERGELSFEDFSAEFEREARDAGYTVSGADVIALLSGKPRPAMIEAVRRCREQYLVGLATNNFGALPAADTAGTTAGGGVAGVLSLFDEVVESWRIGVRKPEVGFFEVCCERLGIRAHEAVFIDDLGVNLKPARLMGMTTIKFVSEEQAIGDLEAALRLTLR
jgi:putative hydrolase of the HAD superfamily